MSKKLSELTITGRQAAIVIVVLFIGGCATLVAPPDYTPPLVSTQIQATKAPRSESSEVPVNEPELDPGLVDEDELEPELVIEYYEVTKVVDGDTIKVDINGTVESVRLIGIDTPETVDPRKAVECFGKEASDYAKNLMTGERVRLESDPSQGDRDKYSRLLRYVYLENGTLVNQLMITQGFAYEYTYDKPYKHRLSFKTAQATAETGGIGLWATDACLLPEPEPIYVPPSPAP